MQRSDIIHQLNLLDLTTEGEKGERIERLLQMIKLSFDMFKAVDQKAADNEKEANKPSSTHVQMDLEELKDDDENADSVQEIL